MLDNLLKRIQESTSPVYLLSYSDDDVLVVASDKKKYLYRGCSLSTYKLLRKYAEKQLYGKMWNVISKLNQIV